MVPTESVGVLRPTLFVIFVAVCMVAAGLTTRWAVSGYAPQDTSSVIGGQQSQLIVRNIKADLASLDTRPTLDWLRSVAGREAGVPSVVTAYAAERLVSRTEAPFDAVFAEPSGPEHVLRRGFEWSNVAVDPVEFAAASPGELKCLAEAVYFEARGENQAGQAAVAQVVINRVRNRHYPNTICQVVYQNETKRHRCQFSFACDGKVERVGNRSAWRRAMDVARRVLAGNDQRTVSVHSATHYHADSVSPVWAGRMRKVDTIGRHIFYSMGRRS
ncbi:MAG: cell wall hydrolase [Hyphomicrobiales bacterium]|nr:cell wall hydrolase [Hyphomicrobiales bacterium]